MAHIHSVYDTDSHFVIDPIARVVRNTNKKTKLIQHDHNSERFTFELPRYIEQHDMLTCNVIEVHFTNTDPITKKYFVGKSLLDDLQLSPASNDVVICSWLIPHDATQLAGTLDFVVRFSCVSDTAADYAWHSAIAVIDVVEGIYNPDAIMTQYEDKFTAWQNETRAEAYEWAESKVIEDHEKEIADLQAAHNQEVENYEKEIAEIKAAHKSELIALYDRSASELTLPDGLTKLGYGAVGDFDNLASITIPEGVTSIGARAFHSCANLVDIALPDTLDMIDNYAFYDCQKLALTSLPAGLKTLGQYVFYQCSELDLTSLPAGLNIGQYAFRACTKLALTSLPDDVVIDIGAFYECPNLALTSLPSSWELIPNHCFNSCTNLALTSLPESIKSLGTSAFRYTGVAFSSLPEGLTTLGDYSLMGCNNITNLELPASLATIGVKAFQLNTGLTSVTFKGKPTSIDVNAFNGCTNLTTINVPWAEGEVKNAPWGATSATINYNYTE